MLPCFPYLNCSNKNANKNEARPPCGERACWLCVCPSGGYAARRFSVRLELRTSGHQSLASLVALVLLEVLDEALSQILGLDIPL